MKPNIIIILTDDLGYGDCSCYGQETWQTENIDKLAAEGIRFTDFYTTSPVCSPARASLLTGLNSGRCPIRELKDPYLPDDLMTIPKILKGKGYVSACIGKYGVGNGQPRDDALKKGFDYHYGYNSMQHAHNYFPPFLIEDGEKVMLRNRPPKNDIKQWDSGVGVAEEKIDYSPDFIEHKALKFIESNKYNPFFLYYCPTLPHANNEGGDSPDGMEVDTYGEFEHRDWSENEKGFARMIQRIDITVGRIVNKVKEVGIEDNTIIIFTSDNGPHNEGGHSVTKFNSTGGFRGYKRSLHEGGIRIPFIVKWPNKIRPGQVSDHIGYFPDIINTLCDITGANKVPYSDGISFVALLNGDNEKQEQHVYIYFEYMGQCAVRKGDWKFYRDSEGNESLYNLKEDRHEDEDIKEDNKTIFNQLKKYARAEHRDYDPFDLPPASKVKYSSK
ncbi:MAG: arylsulfatase [Clostridiales bacterium]|nr:arylsulfatase [Clostridiales bacterium]